MLFTVFIAIIFVEIFLSFKLLRKARLAVARSNNVGEKLFGRRYHSVYELYMDFNFFNDLFGGGNISSVKDDELVAELSEMRKILIFQVVGGFLFFFVGMALGLTQ